MDSRCNRNQFVSELEDSENSPENSGDSPRSSAFSDTKIASTSASKRSRRALQKRVVSIPIKDVEKMRGDQMSAPPSDSWAWRKYGQKPIKGSPYPRGYYRCSSSKGCPARKQVERSRVDPTMLLVTYSCEHNHPWPASRNNNNHHQHTAAAASAASAKVTTPVSEEEEEEEEEKKPASFSSQSHEQVPEYKFNEVPLMYGSDYGWFTDFEHTNCTMLENPILTEEKVAADNEMAMLFTMREEDEPLFADLGELPECSTVFRRGMVQREEAEQRRSSLTTTS